jgi:resuscitation-promoting factor RpfA
MMLSFPNGGAGAKNPGGRHARHRPSDADRTRRDAGRRKAVRLSFTGAVVGALAASPMMLAGPADAATGKTWNRLAMCESSGRWHINTGNGYFGGLQFGQPTWVGFGGRRYAKRADLASRMGQILTAEKVLKVQGWQAWPSCSHKLGLTHADKAGDPRGRTKKAPRKGPGDGYAEYRVVAGDTLSRIAVKRHQKGGWKAIWERNRRVLKNPNLIYVGQRLDVT